MTRSRLKNKANKSGKEEDLKAYKKQRNLVLKLNRKAKKNFLKSCISTNYEMKSKNFWKLCKPFFTEKGSQYNQNIMLTEKKHSISEKHKVANIFNKYFVNITKTLNIPEWKPQKGLTFQNLDIILDTFSSHPSVIQIKEKTNKDVFSFCHVLHWKTYRAIRSINQNNSSSGTIPTKVLRSLAKEICIPLTDCINRIILKEKFPSELKMADVIPIFKKGDPFEKANYWSISLLPSLSKVYKKLIYQQLSTFFENKLSPLLCGFRSRYSTQHELLNLINKWHSCLDNSGVVGTILMDLSKAFDCLPHELNLAKLHAYGVDVTSLKLLQDYLFN